MGRYMTLSEQFKVAINMVIEISKEKNSYSQDLQLIGLYEHLLRMYEELFDEYD